MQAQQFNTMNALFYSIPTLKGVGLNSVCSVSQNKASIRLAHSLCTNIVYTNSIIHHVSKCFTIPLPCQHKIHNESRAITAIHEYTQLYIAFKLKLLDYNLQGMTELYSLYISQFLFCDKACMKITHMLCTIPLDPSTLPRTIIVQ